MTYPDKALSRIIWQYRNSPKFERWVRVLPMILEGQLARPAEQIVNLINVDNARGEALDICGRIAGIDRPKILSGDLAVFAYNGTPGAQPYGVAPYRSPGTPIASIPIPDYLYRVVIRAKIIKNASMALIDDVKRGVEFILGGDITATVVDLQDMSIRIILSQEPSFNVRAILDIFDVAPRPQGVSIEYVTTGFYFSQSGELGGDPLGAVTLGGAE